MNDDGVRHYVCHSCRAIGHGVEPDPPEGWGRSVKPQPGPGAPVHRFYCTPCARKRASIL